MARRHHLISPSSSFLSLLFLYLFCCWQGLGWEGPFALIALLFIIESIQHTNGKRLPVPPKSKFWSRPYLQEVSLSLSQDAKEGFWDSLHCTLIEKNWPSSKAPSNAKAHPISWRMLIPGRLVKKVSCFAGDVRQWGILKTTPQRLRWKSSHRLYLEIGLEVTLGEMNMMKDTPCKNRSLSDSFRNHQCDWQVKRYFPFIWSAFRTSGLTKNYFGGHRPA